MSKHPKPTVKKPKPKRLWLAPLLFLGACSTNMIHVDAIADSVFLITERDDAYLRADDSLSDLERDIFLRDNELLRGVIEEAQK